MNQDLINAKLSEFLITERQKTGLSQSDVAQRSNAFGLDTLLDQRSVSRIEKKPLYTEGIKMAGYLSAIGLNPSKYYDFISEITSINTNKVFTVNTGKIVTMKINLFIKQLDNLKTKVSSSNLLTIENAELLNEIKNIEASVSMANIKPIIGCFGVFDSGKSTFINTILNNQNLLPEGFQPTSSINVLIVHQSDRPNTIKSKVAVFNENFLPYMINDEELVKKHLVSEGDIDLLHEIGKHDYDNEEQVNSYFAVVFAENDILKKVWFLDTPGDLNSSNQQDTKNAFNGIAVIDGLVYLSSLNGFLSGPDLGYFANIMRNKQPIDSDKPFEHVKIIQTHCHDAIKNEQIKQTTVKTFKRLKTQIEDMIFETWLDDKTILEIPDTSNLEQITFPFWRENNDYVCQIIKEINSLSEYLELENDSKIEKVLKNNQKQLFNILNKNLNLLDEKKEDITTRKKHYDTQLIHYDKNLHKSYDGYEELKTMCEKLRKDNLNKVKDIAVKRISVENIEKLIKKTYDDKKEAQKNVGEYISQLIQIDIEKTLKNSGEEFNNKLDEWLVDWQDIMPKHSFEKDETNENFDESFFDSRAAFLGGLAGLGSFGAMAFYVSTITSNLGAYILVGKLAGVLVSLGLASSVTSVTAFVAAIGGPITIGIALAAFIGAMVFGIFGSWQNALAKKVHKALEKNKVTDKLENIVNKFWDDTLVSLEKGFDELKKQSSIHFDNLETQAETAYEISDLNNDIETLKNIFEDFK